MTSSHIRQANGPAPMASRLLAVATRLLPPGDRARYLEEFRAELASIAEAGSSRQAQLAYAARQMASAWRLRNVLHAPRRPHNGRPEAVRRLALEQQRLLKEQRSVCVALLRTARDFRVAVENIYDHHGEYMREHLQDIRQRAVDITGQADEIGFLIPGLDTTADALADAARLIFRGVESSSPDQGAWMQSLDICQLDQRIQDFMSSARTMLDSAPSTTEDPSVD